MKTHDFWYDDFDGHLKTRDFWYETKNGNSNESSILGKQPIFLIM